MTVTEKEQRAISSLKQLAKHWPSSLWLFSASGTLCVMKKNAEGKKAYRIGARGDAADPDYLITSVDIENDGGDW